MGECVCVWFFVNEVLFVLWLFCVIEVFWCCVKYLGYGVSVRLWSVFFVLYFCCGFWIIVVVWLLVGVRLLVIWFVGFVGSLGYLFVMLCWWKFMLLILMCLVIVFDGVSFVSLFRFILVIIVLDWVDWFWLLCW